MYQKTNIIKLMKMLHNGDPDFLIIRNIHSEVKENEVKLFDKVIQVEVNRKNAPNLTLYDMPGLNFNDSLRKKSKEINEKF